MYFVVGAGGATGVVVTVGDGDGAGAADVVAIGTWRGSAVLVAVVVIACERPVGRGGSMVADELSVDAITGAVGVSGAGTGVTTTTALPLAGVVVVDEATVVGPSG